MGRNKNTSNYVLRSLQEDFFTSKIYADELAEVHKIMLMQTNSKEEIQYPIYFWLNADHYDVPMAMNQSYIESQTAVENLLEKNTSLNLHNTLESLQKEFENRSGSIVFPVEISGRFQGLVTFEKTPGKNDWTENEKSFLKAFTITLSLSMMALEENKFFVNVTGILDRIMDQMHASLFVTDIDTDEILYMNKTMKNDFKDEHPEGKYCWQVLQNNQVGRCSHCPKHYLLQSNEEHPAHVWEEYNLKTKKIYENYDSLTQWVDGRLVHFQQAIDVTENKRLSNAVNYDALTRAYSRGKGKEMLSDTLVHAKKANISFALCMIDVNDLKLINDTYGHLQGDRLLSSITKAIDKFCNEKDFICRLSGDEFFVTFINYTKQDADYKIKQILEYLKEEQLFPELHRSQEFCYGIVEVLPSQNYTTKQLLSEVDESLYESKKIYHIQKSNSLLQAQEFSYREIENFEYDKDLLYDALVKSTDDYIFIGNMNTGTFCYSQTMVDDFDLPSCVIENAAAVWGLKVHEQDKEKFLASNQEVIDGRCNSHEIEYRAKNRYGKWVWLRCSGQVITSQDQKESIFAGFISNLSKKNEIDNISGLYNKFAFEQEVERMLETNSEPFALILVNIDNFKHINALNNRSFGDGVIKLISQKLKGLLSLKQSIYRLDGDEFGILCPNASIDEITLFYSTIQNIFKDSQTYEHKNFYISLSCGCAFAFKDANNYQDLNKYADYALNLAKHKGKNRLEFFSEDILDARQRTLEITTILRDSIENGFKGFEMVYQSINRNEKDLSGAEALARFKCEKYGNISPVEFIPLLEQSGLIIPFGKWSFKESIKTLKLFQTYQPDFKININLSIKQLENNDFVNFAKTFLLENQLDGASIIVELTESCIAENLNTLSSVLKDIHSIHIKIAMDDFGTGYSSLGLLKAIPFDFVKIDRTFVQGIRKDTFDHAFIKLVVEMCKILDIKSLLEGVEKSDEYDVCSKLSLDYFQGYYFSKPITKEAFIKKFLAK